MEDLIFITCASIITGISLSFGFLVSKWFMRSTESTICQYDYWKLEDEKKWLNMHRKINYKGKIEELKVKYKNK